MPFCGDGIKKTARLLLMLRLRTIDFAVITVVVGGDYSGKITVMRAAAAVVPVVIVNAQTPLTISWQSWLQLWYEN